MAGESERIDRLELEIKQLREALGESGARRRVADISSDELQAFVKVRDVLVSDFGDFCGINDCFRCIALCRVCQVCQVCSVCRACIFECSCGPCSGGGGLQGGLNRFRELG
jgi:hypothetical protein